MKKNEKSNGGHIIYWLMLSRKTYPILSPKQHMQYISIKEASDVCRIDVTRAVKYTLMWRGRYHLNLLKSHDRCLSRTITTTKLKQQSNDTQYILEA